MSRTRIQIPFQDRLAKERHPRERQRIADPPTALLAGGRGWRRKGSP